MRKIVDMKTLPESEVKRCMDSIVYYYNNYARKEGHPELTEDQYTKFQEEVSKGWLKPKRNKTMLYPLTENECFKDE